MSAVINTYPADARGRETTFCTVPFEEKHLHRLAQIALEDMNEFFEHRPELEPHRFCVVLAQQGADHYLHQTGFRCISVFTLFKKAECKDFYAPRHVRVDIGTDEFGHSSWIKHPCDKGNIGRGVNCYGRSILFQEGDTPQTAVERYLTHNKSKGAATLKKHAVVVLWPKEDFGKVIWDPRSQ